MPEYETKRCHDDEDLADAEIEPVPVLGASNWCPRREHGEARTKRTVELARAPGSVPDRPMRCLPGVADRSRRAADIYLEYMLLGLGSGVMTAFLLRNFLDNWYGHSREARLPQGTTGLFVTSSGNPRWFNTGDLKLGKRGRATARNYFDFVSCEAERVCREESEEPLIKEHAVPVKTLGLMLRGASERFQDLSATDLRLLLERFYKVALVTKEDDARINETRAANGKSLRDQPTVEWWERWKEVLQDASEPGDLVAEEGLDCRDRYRAARIELVPARDDRMGSH